MPELRPGPHPIRAFLITLVVFALGATWMWIDRILPGLDGGAHWSWFVMPAVYASLLTWMAVKWISYFRTRYWVDRHVQRVEELPASFSLIAFHGHLEEEVIAWLDDLSAGLARRKRIFDEFWELVGTLASAQRFNEPGTLWMAVYTTKSHTVLVDWPIPRTGLDAEAVEYYAEHPEPMFAGALRFADTPLTEFCAEHGTVSTVIGWDRIYQSVVLREFRGSGLTEQTVVVAGNPMTPDEHSSEEQKEAGQDSMLLGEPTVDGIRHALRRRGIDPQELFGKIDATPLLVRLEASGASV
jgi:hypothetical protein